MVNKEGRKQKKRRQQKRRLKLQKEIQYCTDFQFIRNENVIEYIKRSKVMFIMRGLPGSGKSTIVNLLQRTYKRGTVCSADNFFYHDGRYEYNVNLLSSAHNHCQEIAKSACAKGHKVVIIDNTNIRKWEMKFYLNLAVENNYVVVPVLPKTRWRFDPVELAKRNKHGVTADVIEKKIKIFDDMIPLYYGWFLNELESRKLLEIGHGLYLECLKEVPDLATELLNVATAEDDHCNDESQVLLRLDGYFKRYSAAGMLHSTAMFCRWGKEPGARLYHEREIVQKSCGQTYRLNIIGLVITPRTLAARIQLTDRQLRLWGQDEREKLHISCSSHHRNPTSDTKNASIRSGQSTASVCDPRNSSVDSNLVQACSKLSLTSAEDWSTTEQPNHPSEEEIGAKNSFSRNGCLPAMLPPMLRVGQSAHITLGCANGILAKQSGLDIMEIQELAFLDKCRFAPIQTKNSVIYYYGEGRCQIIFKETYKVESLFSGFY